MPPLRTGYSPSGWYLSPFSYTPPPKTYTSPSISCTQSAAPVFKTATTAQCVTKWLSARIASLATSSPRTNTLSLTEPELESWKPNPNKSAFGRGLAKSKPGSNRSARNSWKRAARVNPPLPGRAHHAQVVLRESGAELRGDCEGGDSACDSVYAESGLPFTSNSDHLLV
jgi:hypothetical protein